MINKTRHVAQPSCMHEIKTLHRYTSMQYNPESKKVLTISLRKFYLILPAM